MVILIVESAPASLRGQLSKWMLEPKAGVFVGTVAASVRELLWEKTCREVSDGGAIMIHATNSEQGFAIRSFGETDREIELWEGLYLVRRLNQSSQVLGEEGSEPEDSPVELNDLSHPSIWGKTARGVMIGQDEPRWHPLLCHMVDAAMVASRLWDYLLPPIIKDRVRTSLGVGTADEAGRWVAYFAGLHDLGKANPGFALRWGELAPRLLDEGLRPASVAETSPHGFVTAYLLGELLPSMGFSRPTAAAIGFAVGGHHGRFPAPLDLEGIEDRVGSKRWREAQRHLALALARVLQVDGLPPPPAALAQDNAFLMLVAGLTCVADWVSSNHAYFRFAGDTAQWPHYGRRSRRTALYALQDLGWFHRPVLVEPRPFPELFDVLPNPLQSTIEQIAGRLEGPSLVIMEYPMGGGKTEAALFLANALEARVGQQGIYVALPTMATSNQMFDRVAEFLASRSPTGRLNVQLLHGQADLNPHYARLRERGRRSRELPVIEDEEHSDGHLLAAEWFTHRKQGLLAPFAVGTIDQALLAALDTKHYFVRLFGLAGKVVIVDEVHTYDVYMSSLLDRLISWLAAVGSSVILLSATLPARTRQQLLAAYARGRQQSTPSDRPEPGYPRVTWLSNRGVDSLGVRGPASRRICLRSFSADDLAWMPALAEVLEQGGSAAVICNTVTRAQETYQALHAHFAAEELLLLHARYPYDERLRREQYVVRAFGKNADRRPYRCVCVATQVLEQSLDLDFDIMVTELAPVDLVLQRAGRVWRHPLTDRPPGITEPALWLILPSVSGQGVPAFDRPTSTVYDPHLLFRSYLVLRSRVTLNVPADIEPLVEAVYQNVEPPSDMPAELATYWHATADHLLSGETRDRRKARIREIPEVDSDLMDVRAFGLDEEDVTIHESHQALTRLGGPSVTVVCVFERDGEVRLSADGGAPFPLDLKPDPEAIRALLGRALTLSFDPGLVRTILEQPVPLEWQATAHLRRHRLLRFATDGTCLVPGLSLRLDPDLGLYKTMDTKEDR